MCAKGVHFMSGHMKFVYFRGGGWWDSWYKAAKDKVFILCFMFLCISAPKQDLGSVITFVCLGTKSVQACSIFHILITVHVLIMLSVDLNVLCTMHSCDSFVRSPTN